LVHREPSAENLSDDTVESISEAWNLPPRFPTPPERKIHVWLIELDRPDAEIGFERILGAEELERAARLRSEKARARFRGSHVAVRRILAGYMGCGPRDLRFEHGATGKPSLSGGDETTSRPSFNLSHSGDVALCAASACGEVGVDVEEVRTLRDVERLAARHFSRDELTGWQTLGPEERLPGFYRTWTRKEALLKAAGLGLSRPLQRVDTRRGILDAVSYWVRDLTLSASFRAAIACAGRPDGVQCLRWENSLAPTGGS